MRLFITCDNAFQIDAVLSVL